MPLVGDMMARCVAFFIFIVLFLFVLVFIPVGAEPGPVNILVASRQVEIPSSQAYLDSNGVVKAPVEVLRVLDVSYVVGENRVTVVDDGRTYELRVTKHLGSTFIDLADASKLLGFVYVFDKDSMTAQIKAKLVSFDFAEGKLKAVFDLPVQPSSVRLWQDPWRLSIDIKGAVVSVDERSLNVGSADVKGVRVGQFDQDTVRIVIDLTSKLPYKLLTVGLSRELQVAVGSEISKTAAESKPPAEPPAVTGVVFDPVDNDSATIKVLVAGKPEFAASMLSDPLRLVIDIKGVVLPEPIADIDAKHPLVSSVRIGEQKNMVRVVLDLQRYVIYHVSVDSESVMIGIKMPAAAGGKLSQKTIVLDPGHGGKQTGAIAGGVKEKDLNLLIARQVKVALEEKGARVIMTRTDDSELDLPSRPAVADRVGGDIFISIHCNACGVPDKMSGVETYYHPAQLSSRALAAAIHDAVVKKTGLKDRSIRERSGLAVLRHSRVPAVLLECGYLDNSKDRGLLLSSDFRKKFASAVADGLKAYVEGGSAIGGGED